MKFDKHLEGSRGMDYWMFLWRDQSGDVSFLHSALQVQVDAIESMHAQAIDDGQSDCPVKQATFSVKNRLSKEDLTCPICLASPQMTSLPCWGSLFRMFSTTLLRYRVVMSIVCLVCWKLATLEKHLELFGHWCQTSAQIGHVASADNKMCTRTLPSSQSWNLSSAHSTISLLSEACSTLTDRFPDAWKERDKEEKKILAEKKQRLQKQQFRQAKDCGKFHPAFILL